jgi:hypothetical protein
MLTRRQQLLDVKEENKAIVRRLIEALNKRNIYFCLYMLNFCNLKRDVPRWQRNKKNSQLIFKNS